MINQIKTGKSYNFEGKKVFVIKVTKPTFGRGSLVTISYEEGHEEKHQIVGADEFRKLAEQKLFITKKELQKLIKEEIEMPTRAPYESGEANFGTYVQALTEEITDNARATSAINRMVAENGEDGFFVPSRLEDIDSFADDIAEKCFTDMRFKSCIRNKIKAMLRKAMQPE